MQTSMKRFAPLLALGVAIFSIFFLISINTKELGYYNTDISDWVIEEGKYTLYIGNASNNITKKIIKRGTYKL